MIVLYEIRTTKSGETTGSLNCIKSQKKIIRLVDNLFANTMPETVAAVCPFWEHMERQLLNSLFLIVWLEHERYGWENSVNTVKWLLSKIKPDGDTDELSMIFNKIVTDTNGNKNGGEKHPAWYGYNIVEREKPAVRQSIAISVNGRLSIFNKLDVKDILNRSGQGGDNTGEPLNR